MPSGYLWFDAEFSSLELDEARLLQVALMATGPDLKRLAPPDRDVNLFIKLDDPSVLSPWVRENIPHIVAQCHEPGAVSIEEAEVLLCRYVDEVVGPMDQTSDHRPLLAGNSIHNDWFLARKFFPGLLRRAHYRLLDVSTFKTQWCDWYGGKPFDKEKSRNILRHFKGANLDAAMREHDAYYDIQASIAEMAYYRSQLSMKKSPGR